jgi:hypothetical protein
MNSKHRKTLEAIFSDPVSPATLGATLKPCSSRSEPSSEKGLARESTSY